MHTIESGKRDGAGQEDMPQNDPGGDKQEKAGQRMPIKSGAVGEKGCSQADGGCDQ